LNQVLKIKGTKLVHFQNCTVEINNATYFDYISSHWDEVHIYPATITNINYSSTIEDFKIKKLKTYHIDNKNAIQMLEVNTERQNYFIHGIIIFNIILILIILAYFLFKKSYKQKINIPLEIKQTMKHQPKAQLRWPSLHS